MGWGLVADGESGSWHSDVRAAGPAGAVSLDLPVGIRLVFDRAQPSTLVALAVFPTVSEDPIDPVDAALDHDALAAALTGLGVTPGVSAALSRPAPSEPEVVPLEVDFDAIPRPLRRILGELAVVSAALDGLDDAPHEVLAIAQLERAWLELQLPSALRDEDEIELTVGAALTCWAPGAAARLHDDLDVPFLRLLDRFGALGSSLQQVLGSDAPVVTGFADLQASMEAASASGQLDAGLLDAWRDQALVAALHLGSRSLDATSRLPWADPDEDPVGTILHLLFPDDPALPEAVVDRDGEALVFTIARGAIESDQPWVYAYAGDALVAALPLELDGDRWQARIITNAPATRTIVAPGPETRRPDGPTALAVIEAAIRDGRQGIASEEDRFGGAAARAWLRCGARWLMLGDGIRCATALGYGADDLRAVGSDDQAVALQALAEALSTDDLPSRDRRGLLLWPQVRRALERTPDP